MFNFLPCSFLSSLSIKRAKFFQFSTIIVQSSTLLANCKMLIPLNCILKYLQDKSIITLKSSVHSSTNQLLTPEILMPGIGAVFLLFNEEQKVLPPTLVALEHSSHCHCCHHLTQKRPMTDVNIDWGESNQQYSSNIYTLFLFIITLYYQPHTANLSMFYLN